MRHLRTLAAVVVGALVVTGCGSKAPSPASPTTALVDIGAGLQGVEGLHAAVYATGLTHATAMAFDSSGRLWVATADYSDAGQDALYVVTQAGAAPSAVVTGLHTPLGLLWLDDTLYIASKERVAAYLGFDGTAFTSQHPVVTLPAGVGEVNGLALGPDGRIRLGISAPCDHCVPASELSGAVVSFLPDGTDLRVDAGGIRAPIGLMYFPGTDKLFVTMNQRDDLGDQTPGDWLSIVQQGQAWGFPDCYGQGGAACAGKPGPVAELDAHAAVSGVAIVTGEVSATTGTAALVAEWETGKVQRVALGADSSSTGAGAASDLTGVYLTGMKNPFGLVLGPDHGLYAGDWATGTIYGISP
jgi:glucose/arabinose dehydrogenase